jgi:hypothetical protein
MTNRDLRERDHFEDLALDERIILKRTLRIRMRKPGLDCSGLG